jgi:hypothetical protein
MESRPHHGTIVTLTFPPERVVQAKDQRAA